MCALFILHFIVLPAMIHLVRLSKGKGLPRFQHFRSTKTSNKFLNAPGKIISAETLLDKNIFVAFLERLKIWFFITEVSRYISQGTHCV